MKRNEILGALLGLFGIFLLDVGFSGSSMTDLFYIGPRITSVIPKGAVPAVSPNIGANLLGNLIPVGDSTLFFIGGGFLGLGMIILILHNRNLGKSSITAVLPK